jgi:N-acetyl-1-D-myo-inositol-2-amino-2-deoxy-alpha-D-glucopyranoside deacetylase
MRTRSLFLVHAHPDDESVATGGVILRARVDGHRVVVVTCTGGEEGEVHDDALLAGGGTLADVRADELRRASTILGVDRLELLGYRDSGMAGSPANQHPASFHRSSLDEVAGRLVLLLWAEQPDVVVTYGPDGTYGHPDHVRAHQATTAALRVLAREGWSPARFFWHVVPCGAVERLRGRLGTRTHPAMAGVGTPDHEVTTAVDLGAVLPLKRAAIAAHVSQVPPDPMTAMTGQVLDAVDGFEHFVLAGGHVRSRPGGDLFEGLAAPATAGAVRA